MSKQQTNPMTYTQALDEYFGGLKALARKPLPFKCRCGGTTYTDENDKGESVEKAILSLTEIYQHIRKNHRERVKTPEAIKRDLAKKHV